MQPEKIDLSAATISEEKLAQLRDLLPEVFHEGKINFDELKNALGEYVEEDPANERFGLRWPGKSKLQQVINTPSVGTLVPQLEESVDWDDTGNIIIEGDNLEVLKLLQKSYAGKVKMIYIDPPYNTGNDFVYPDDLKDPLKHYERITGQLDDNGHRLVSNSDSSGRYHANWLNMMYPRLYLARNLLRQDGVIFVSIDDAEVANLRLLMDQVLGEDEFLANVIWIKKYSPANDSKGFSDNHDHILTYRRSSDFERNLLPRTEANNAMYRYDDDDGKGRYRTSDLSVRSYSAAYDYPIMNPNTGEWHNPPAGRCWNTNQAQMQRWVDDGRIYWGRGGLGSPSFKRYLSEVKDGVVPVSVWSHDQVGHNDESRKEIRSLFSSTDLFDTPKPTRLVQQMLHIGVNQNDIILDFFAGSGTTGHAVMQQNAEDGGNRKYILVQLPEPMEPKTLDDGTQLNTIADICRERVRRAGRKIADENPDKDLDIGFRAYKLAPSNFQPWDGTPSDNDMMTSARQASFMPQTQQLSLEQRILQAADHLNPAADDIAILTELLLKLGEELTVPVEQLSLAGKTVYDINGNARLICLEREISLDVIREMAAREPLEIICLDAGFPDDQTKVNAGQIIATQAQHIEGAIAFKVV